MNWTLQRACVQEAAAVDVVVIGAGSAGCIAAIAARTSGARRVLLVERYGFAGGTSTAVLDTFYGFYTPGDHPRKVVGGLADRVVNALTAASAVRLRPNSYGAGTGVTYDPERLTVVWDTLLHDAGVTVLHHATLIDVAMRADDTIAAVVLATRGGLLRVEAARCIDTSGDADLCALAGAAYERAGDLAPAQTLTTTFRMANVDLDSYTAAGGKTMLAARMAEAVDRGTHALPRRHGSAHPMVHDHCVATVATRVAHVDATDPWALSEAEREGRAQAYAYEAFFRERIPGFSEARIVALSTQIGVRETRRVHGAYRLTRDDCLSVRRFDDRVLLCGAPIEDHRVGDGDDDETKWAYVPGGAAYDVPCRTLVPAGRDDLWVAGRCFSATHDAHASCRSMAQTMAMGQAVGTAAALSLSLDCSARAVPIVALQDRLRRMGAVLKTPEVVADEPGVRVPDVPTAPFVRTVTGDVPADALGWCHAHEHLIIDPGFATHLEPEFLLDSVDAAVAEVRSLHAVGVRALVDATPAACGRSPLKLAEVTRRTSVHIVCPTGVHLRRYYPPGHWGRPRLGGRPGRAVCRRHRGGRRRQRLQRSAAGADEGACRCDQGGRQRTGPQRPRAAPFRGGGPRAPHDRLSHPHAHVGWPGRPRAVRRARGTGRRSRPRRAVTSRSGARHRSAPQPVAARRVSRVRQRVQVAGRQQSHPRSLRRAGTSLSGSDSARHGRSPTPVLACLRRQARVGVPRHHFLR